jgi:hypothetical protein
MKTMKSLDVTEHTIRALKTEAAENGDTTLVRTCNRALRGDTEALRAVLRVLQEAEAQKENHGNANLSIGCKNEKAAICRYAFTVPVLQCEDVE